LKSTFVDLMSSLEWLRMLGFFELFVLSLVLSEDKSGP